jgi:cytochrome d ubiquinol oxidase subunit I
MRIDQAISPNVTPTMLLISLIGFTVVYGALMVADIYLLQKFARAGVGEHEPESAPDSSSAKQPRLTQAY